MTRELLPGLIRRYNESVGGVNSDRHNAQKAQGDDSCEL